MYKLDLTLNGLVKLNIMDDDFTEHTLNNLAELNQDASIKLVKFYLLADGDDKYSIAINWKSNNELYFKMFKYLNKIEILTFSNSLSKRHNNGWSNQISNWFSKPMTPLVLRSE